MIPALLLVEVLIYISIIVIVWKFFIIPIMRACTKDINNFKKEVKKAEKELK